MLTITPVVGRAITFSSRDIQDPRLKSGFSRHTGIEGGDAVTFFFERYVRARLPELEPLAGRGVTQTRNRAGLVQLVSLEPCSFVRVEWDAARVKGFARSWNQIFAEARTEGVFEITEASMDGLGETLALTLYRGDWLYKQDGTVERF
jgi:hypothetical protein